MQHSSATTIVLVVLGLFVSTAALSAHQQAVNHAEAIAQLTDRAGYRTRPAASEHDSTQARMAPMAAIRCVEQKLRVVSRDLRSKSTEKRSNAFSRARPLIKAISALHARIDQSDGSTERDKREARMITLRATYVGAREIPAEYAHPFVTIAQGIVQRSPGSEEAAEAEALMLLWRCAWGGPAGDAVVGDLARFAGNYPNSQWAVALWGLASEEYQRKGLAESARAVLHHGIRFYSGRPQAAVLASKLAEHGHGAPPKAQLTGKQSLQHYVSGETCANGAASGSGFR